MTHEEISVFSPQSASIFLEFCPEGQPGRIAGVPRSGSWPSGPEDDENWCPSAQGSRR
jgi:hypothetical protein